MKTPTELPPLIVSEPGDRADNGRGAVFVLVKSPAGRRQCDRLWRGEDACRWSKTIVLGAGLAMLAGLTFVFTLAQPTADAIVPMSGVSAVLETR